MIKLVLWLDRYTKIREKDANEWWQKIDSMENRHQQRVANLLDFLQSARNENDILRRQNDSRKPLVIHVTERFSQYELDQCKDPIGFVRLKMEEIENKLLSAVKSKIVYSNKIVGGHKYIDAKIVLMGE